MDTPRVRGWLAIATIGTLVVARATAWAALEVAKTSLKIAQAIVVVADPSLDPRVVALVATRTIAWTALTAAEGVVMAARAAVTGFSSLTQFIVDWGLGGAFSITSASLEADFSKVRGRTLDLSADIVFLGQSTNVQFQFNFDDPLASVNSLAMALLKDAGIDVPS
jgi:hypothetical protein